MKCSYVTAKSRKEIILDMLPCSLTLSDTAMELHSPLFLEKRRDECYKKRRPREEAEAGGIYTVLPMSRRR